MNTIRSILSVNLTLVLQLIFSLLLSHSIASRVFSAPLYKWIDEDGEIRYSDNLPSDQSKKGFQKIAPDGRVISTIEKSKTPEQLREQRATKKRLEQKNRVEAEVAAKQAALQEHHDNVLLMTFTNESEILTAKIERLSVIDSVIKLLEKNIKTEQVKLQKEEAIAKRLYLDKNIVVPGGQAQKIEYFTEKVLSKEQHLRQKMSERDKVKQQYIVDLVRYRELIKLKQQREIAEQAEKARLREHSLYYDE